MIGHVRLPPARLVHAPGQDWEMRPISPPEPRGFVVAVDLGQAADWTAISVIERSVAWEAAFQRTPAHPAGERIGPEERRVHHDVRLLRRPPLGTPYPEIVRLVAGVLRSLPPKREAPALVVDATGVGRPVVEQMRAEGLPACGVSITAGEAETLDGRDARVAKRVLAGLVAVTLEGGRLRIAAGLDLAPVLAAELRTFKVKITAAGGERFEAWREREHDDIVLSVALGVWRGERLREPVDPRAFAGWNVR